MRRVMQIALTLVSPQPDQVQAALGRLAPALAAAGARVKEPRPLGPGALDLALEGEHLDAIRAAAATVLEGSPIDLCVQPWNGRRKKLLVADMDSTIIGCECLDELADFAGVKAQVSAITERAMRGELEFEGALRERVAMLKGLPVADLQLAYDQRVRLNPGARTFVRTMAASGARCLLVSGGFTFFTSRVAAAAGFHEDRANTLGEADGALTGTVGEPILGREAKLAALAGEAKSLGLDLSQTLAIGDGANDLAMIEAAGLGVAYRAKPIVAAQADAKVDHADLTALLYFQGYAQPDFVTD
jgi:phosphoserine phosphatase